ncbi:SRPBCC family protein [Comamonas odontotermitis]|uniref:SRPBCC family protein n=1 Tax=Comamonas odontotermitis TaxID=379895 RepID=UPI001CC7ED47|nr:SRPBCC family protein [Comamonas odontotermitis]UBB18515.1 SRPBCC family protein [Comamonas odontotermitis]
MSTNTTHPQDLVLTRLIDAPAATLYRCWTDPELMKQWFVPKPWTIARVELDLRPGGGSLVVMRDPEGKEYPNAGVYLEVVPERKLVFTDAYTAGWVPTEKPFMTAIVTFEPEGEGGRQTRYTAIARHWTEETRKQHEAMGFHTGWGICADQLAALAATL